MALALYRKYRPRTFAEVIGQEHVTSPLSQALRTGRLHHAYLFSGPRGCGKTSSARILARSLNCEKGPTPDPCGECASCVALAPDGPGSIDVIEIDAASHGGVDDARDLRERAFFAPVSSRYKIYVIDEAHMVSSAGFNALLKLVEEPPDYVKFVFATTEPEKVLGTIKSRTHHYPFRLIPPSVLRPYLEMLCESEHVKVEPNVFPLVVRAGGGSVRDSLSILDQLIGGAGEEGVTYARAVALLGVTDVTLLDEVCDALAAGDGGAVFAAIDRVVEAGHDPRRFAGDLLARLRDLIVLQQVPDALSKGLLDGAEDELARMESQARHFGPATLSRMADVVHTGLIDMRGTTSPRLVLELIAARMLLPGAEDSTGALLQRLERMERRLTSSDGEQPKTAPAEPATSESPGRSAADSKASATSAAAPSAADSAVAAARAAAARAAEPAAAGRVPAAPSPVAQPPVAPPAEAQRSPGTPAPESASPSGAAGPEIPGASAGSAGSAGPKQKAVGALDAADIRRDWELVLAQVRRSNMKMRAIVGDAVVRDVDGNTLVLLFQHQFHANAVSSDPKAVVDALIEVFGGQWQIRCELSGQQTSVTPTTQGATTLVAPLAVPPVDLDDTAGEPDDDWPATTRPPATEAVSTPAEPSASAWASASASASASAKSPAPARSAPAKSAAPARSAPARKAARPGAAGSAASNSTASRPTASSSASSGFATSPEMGFDAGDEPLDDEDGAAVRQSSEEQAIDLLTQTLGAEKI